MLLECDTFFYLQMHDQTCKSKKKIEQTKVSIILESTIEYGKKFLLVHFFWRHFELK